VLIHPHIDARDEEVTDPVHRVHQFKARPIRFFSLLQRPQPSTEIASLTPLLATELERLFLQLGSRVRALAPHRGVDLGVEFLQLLGGCGRISGVSHLDTRPLTVWPVGV
jgi:hypothetical protein